MLISILKVKAFRAASERMSMIKADQNKTLFAYILESKSNYVAILKVSSSENRI